MIYRFEDFELDSARFELRRAGSAVPVEPQVLSLLMLLASNHDRLVSKDEIIEKIWNNRFISEAAVSARIKSARKALGDDGKEQRLLRTIHGRGFRFVGNVAYTQPVQGAFDAAPDNRPDMPEDADLSGRPSIAVLPFRMTGDVGVNAFVADAIAEELIADLSRLRWLFVIARGSSFRFRGQLADYRKVGQVLGVRYCLSGSIAFAGGGFTISVELVEASSNGVIWAQTYTDSMESLHDVRHEIVLKAITALEIRIPLNETQKARSQRPDLLDAWSAYHLGLDHMFRFNRADNLVASEMFGRALARDPHFARAHAGLSFTHFQNAFLNYLPNRSGEVEAARSLAEQALRLDQLDPFCHLNMGRSFWLSGNLAESIEWLDQATALSPNYAQGVYSRAWAQALSGEADAGDRDARLALRLSPLDPLRYAMIATSSLSEVLRGDYEEAAVLGERAARSPGAHKHIAVIAAIATHLAGQPEKSDHWIAMARRSDPDVTAADFLKSFPFAPSSGREKIERVLADLRL